MDNKFDLPRTDTKLELLNLLHEHQGVGIAEEGIGDSFIVSLDNGEPYDSQVKATICLSNDDIDSPLYPVITHNIPNINRYIKIAFKESGTEYPQHDNVGQILRLAQAGLEIMKKFKELSTSERIRFQSKYANRIMDHSEAGVPNATNGCLEMALEAINRELGEEF